LELIFYFTTLLITIFCLWGLIRTLKEKNLFGAGFSFISFALFGWFTTMSFYEVIVDALTKA
jgi:choline-glycine betaine transporter